MVICYDCYFYVVLYGYLSWLLFLCGCIWSFVMTVISMWSAFIIRILYECVVGIDNSVLRVHQT